VLGDLPDDEAKRYFCGEGDGEGGRWAGLVAQLQAPPLEAGAWSDVYAVCGGNMGLLTDCVTLAKQAGGSWGAGGCRALACAAAPSLPCASARRGMLTPRPSIPLLQRWTRSRPPAKKTSRTASAPTHSPCAAAPRRGPRSSTGRRCAASRARAAPHHAVRRSAVERELGEKGEAKGSVALESMVQYNLLALRPFSPQAWASDLPREVYGPVKKREEVVTMPDRPSLRHVLLLEEEWAEGEAVAGSGDWDEGGGGAASG
jgi:hypothetical protein